MDDTLTRIWQDLAGRVTGPMTFRLLLQPLMACLFAIRDGVKDAKHGRPAYFWSLLTDSEQRAARLGEAWKAVSRVFLFAIAIDLVYQWIVFKWFYPGEAIVMAFLLAFVPYVLLRGPVNRLARLRNTGKPTSPSERAT